MYLSELQNRVFVLKSLSNILPSWGHCGLSFFSMRLHYFSSYYCFVCSFVCVFLSFFDGCSLVFAACLVKHCEDETRNMEILKEVKFTVKRC